MKKGRLFYTKSKRKVSSLTRPLILQWLLMKNWVAVKRFYFKNTSTVQNGHTEHFSNDLNIKISPMLTKFWVNCTCIGMSNTFNVSQGNNYTFSVSQRDNWVVIILVSHCTAITTITAHSSMQLYLHWSVK